MRKRWACMIVAALVLALTAVPAAAKSKPPKVLTQEQLQAALLALSDMPSGWAASPIQPATGVCNGPTLPQLVQQGAPAATVDSQFAQDETVGPLVNERLANFKTAAAAKADFALIRDTYTKCTAWDAVLPSGSAYHYTLTPESFSKAGDQTAAFRVVASPQGQTGVISATYDLVFVRKGNVLVPVAVGALTIPSDLTQQFVGKAMAKLSTSQVQATTTTTKRSNVFKPLRLRSQR